MRENAGLLRLCRTKTKEVTTLCELKIGTSSLENAQKLFASCTFSNRQLVGMRFLTNEEEYVASPAQEYRQAMSYCVAVKLASHGYSGKANLGKCGCGGATRALGLERSPEEFITGEEYESFGLYRDREVARKFSSEMKFVEGVNVGYELGPLSYFLDHQLIPDTVIAVLTARDAMRAGQGYAYHRGHANSLRSSGNQAVCSEATVIPYLTDGFNYTMGCSGTRYLAGWKDEELLFGMSTCAFLLTADGLYHTIEGAEDDQRKELLVRKLKSEGFDTSGITQGGGYFIAKSKKPGKGKS